MRLNFLFFSCSMIEKIWLKVISNLSWQGESNRVDGKWFKRLKLSQRYTIWKQHFPFKFLSSLWRLMYLKYLWLFKRAYVHFPYKTQLEMMWLEKNKILNETHVNNKKSKRNRYTQISNWYLKESGMGDARNKLLSNEFDDNQHLPFDSTYISNHTHTWFD